MFSPTTAILAVLPVYILIIGGAVLRRTRVLKREHDAGIMHVIFSVMLPCFILDRTLGAEVLRNPQVLISGAGLGFLFIIVGISLGYLVGKIIGLKPGTGIRTFALGTGCQNYAFTAVPVVEILWGTSAVALLFVHNIGVEIAIWSVGVMLMSGENGIPWKRLINGPIIAVLIGLTLVSLRIDDKITGPIRTAISMLGIGAFPLAIMITGATIMDLVGTEKPSWKIIIAACLVRLFAAPAIIILCAKYIPMAVELQQILLVQAAMPAALVPILLARLYGGRPGVAVQIVIGTTVVSIFTLPYIIFYGIKFLELTPLTP
ncbi:MAG: AEC family transporter [Verrucomicrobia bacterium]|nr:AEC family transporter [Verrucomicrobiota bacterium]